MFVVSRILFVGHLVFILAFTTVAAGYAYYYLGFIILHLLAAVLFMPSDCPHWYRWREGEGLDYTFDLFGRKWKRDEIDIFR